MSHLESAYVLLPRIREAAAVRLRSLLARTRPGACGIAREDLAQGTTEYAILVGVLVVIAIIAVVAFRGTVEELWNAIVEAFEKI